jgi:ParB family chromosome partitioning protein
MSDQFLTLPLASLSPDPHQPRRELENDSAGVTEAHTLQGLANSIREVGILQPIRVRAVVQDDADTGIEDRETRYTIVSGQRRYEAAKMLGLTSVPCLVIDDPADASHTLVSQVTENLQRKAMTASELALAVQSLVQSGATQEAVARKLGIQSSQVSLLLNLLVLSGPVKVAFERGRIESPRAAYDLNKLPPQLQEQLIGEAEHKGRIVTQRDVREVKQLYAHKLSQVRHRYEVPAVTKEEYAEFTNCLVDGVQDHYDPTDDRFAVFGPDWPQWETRQTGVVWGAAGGVSGAVDGGNNNAGIGGAAGQPLHNDADTVDALRVRVPGFTLTRDQVLRLYQRLGETPDALPETAAALGKDLARVLSEI